MTEAASCQSNEANDGAKQILDLIKKSVRAETSGEAIGYAQAALNAAEALRSLKLSENHNG